MIHGEVYGTNGSVRYDGSDGQVQVYGSDEIMAGEIYYT